MFKKQCFCCRRKEAKVYQAPEAPEFKSATAAAASNDTSQKLGLKDAAITASEYTSEKLGIKDRLWDAFVWLIERSSVMRIAFAYIARSDLEAGHALFNRWEQQFGISLDGFAHEERLTLASYRADWYHFLGQVGICAARGARNQHLILSVPSGLASRLDVRFGRVVGPTKDYLRASTDLIDALLADCILPKVFVEGRGPFTLDDVVVVDMVLFNGSLFPKIHNDIEWDLFVGEGGFNVWHLLQNDCDEQGNMFVFELDGKWEPPVHPMVLLSQDGKIATVHHNTNESYFPTPYEAYEELRELGLDPKYVGTAPGECFIFGQNLLHMSDPRGVLQGHKARRAFSFRVAIKEPDGSLKVNLDHGLGSNLTWMNTRLHRHIEQLRKEVPPKVEGGLVRALRDLHKQGVFLCHTDIEGGIEGGRRIGYLHNVSRYDYI